MASEGFRSEAKSSVISTSPVTPSVGQSVFLKLCAIDPQEI